MICIKCGLMKRGAEDFFECDDCKDFSKLVRIIFEDIHEKMERTGSIDPDTHPILRLLADSSFITSKNPHTAIFYKISDYIVSQAFAGATEVTEDELNRHVMTTRGWSDAFKIFEELNLVRIRTEKFRRILVLTDKTRKFATQYLSAERLSEIGVRTRLAHIYGRYVLLYILYKMSNLSIDNFESSLLPYRQRPRTLWITLMFLWSNAYKNTRTFSDEDLRIFVSKRRIPSTTRGKIINALEAKDGRSTQGLIKDVRIEGDERTFEFEDYVLLEMQRIRELLRERER
jgi:hypothetical protein